MRTLKISLIAAGLAFGQPDTVSTELTSVTAKALEKTVNLPGELRPFQKIDIFAKVTGFVESVEVDRGSRVKQGQLLASMSAPELEAQRAETEARVPAIEAQRREAEAELAGATSTLERLREAAKTPGVVAGNDVVLAEKRVEAAEARIASLERSVDAVEAAVRAIAEMEKYLAVEAPFAGVITDRYAHVGSLAGPEGAGSRPLFTLQQVDRLRLQVAVPEAYVESIRKGATVAFSVPAYPGAALSGRVARPALAVDPESRTMPVELDVPNASGKLAPGMYADVRWPVRRSGESLFVPPSAIKATTERIFVIRVSGGTAEWVDVRHGMTEGDLVEVFGDLSAGDRIVLRATDEIRPGTRVEAR